MKNKSNIILITFVMLFIATGLIFAKPIKTLRNKSSNHAKQANSASVSVEKSVLGETKIPSQLQSATQGQVRGESDYTIPAPAVSVDYTGADDSDVAVLVTWQMPDSLDNYAYGYEIKKQGPAGEETAAIYNPATLGILNWQGGGSYYDNAVNTGESYTYSVRAWDKSLVMSDWASASITMSKFEITDIGVEAVDANSAKISFKTGVNSTAIIYYGQDKENYDKEKSEDITTAPATDHSITLTDINDYESKTYYYQIRAMDEKYNVTDSEDKTLFAITDIVATPQDTTATITWKTTVVTLGKIEYGADDKYGQTKEEPNDNVGSEDHSLEITGLTKDTTYHFKITATSDGDLVRPGYQEGGTTISSADQTFTAHGDFQITDISVTFTYNEAEISWETSVDTRCDIDYGLTSSYANKISEDDTYKTEHKLTITGLQQNIDYHYKITATKSTGEKTDSGDKTFKTSGNKFSLSGNYAISYNPIDQNHLPYRIIVRSRENIPATSVSLYVDEYHVDRILTPDHTDIIQTTTLANTSKYTSTQVIRTYSGSDGFGSYTDYYYEVMIDISGWNRDCFSAMLYYYSANPNYYFKEMSFNFYTPRLRDISAWYANDGNDSLEAITDRGNGLYEKVQRGTLYTDLRFPDSFYDIMHPFFPLINYDPNYLGRTTVGWGNWRTPNICKGPCEGGWSSNIYSGIGGGYDENYYKFLAINYQFNGTNIESHDQSGDASYDPGGHVDSATETIQDSTTGEITNHDYLVCNTTSDQTSATLVAGYISNADAESTAQDKSMQIEILDQKNQVVSEKVVSTLNKGVSSSLGFTATGGHQLDGDYKLKISKPGYKTQEIPIKLSKDQKEPPKIDIKLQKTWWRRAIDWTKNTSVNTYQKIKKKF